MSFEAPVLTSSAFTSQNTVLANLLSGLGQGTLRFGGNEVEFTAWQPTSSVTSAVLPATLHTTDLDRVFAFAKSIRWRVILGVNLGHFDPASAADEAAYAAQAGQSTLMAIEIGNEPDFFMFNRQRSPLWGYSDFHNELEAYNQAIHAQVPDAPIAAPVTYGAAGLGWFRQAIADEGTHLTYATHHLYPMTRLPVTLWASPAAPTIDQLLSPAVMENTATIADELVRDSPLPVQISETNSVANSGKSGVSNVFASALWGVDHLFTLAEQGVRGVNFHKGRAAITVHLTIAQSALGGSYICLAVPSLESTTGIALGGQSVNANGEWQAVESIPFEGNTLMVNAASVFLITFTGR